MPGASSTQLPDLDFVQQVATVLDDTDESDINTRYLAASLNVTPIVTDGVTGGSRSSYSAESIVRAHVYRHLRGMDFIQDLSTELSEEPYTARVLGFALSNTPDRTVLSRWWNDYITQDAREAIRVETEDVVRFLYSEGIPLDTQAFEPDEDRGTSERSKSRIKTEKTQEILKNTRKWLYGGIELDRSGPVKYNDTDYFDLITHLALENSFPNDGANGFNDYVEEVSDQRDPDSPTGDSLLYHLKKFEEDELQDLFETLTDRLFHIAKQRDMFEKPVDIALDENAIPYYGDTSDHMVTNMKPRAGTSYGFKYLTACVVGQSGERFTIAFLPVTGSDHRDEIKQILERVQQHVTIKQVYGDRGYYKTRLVIMLQRMGVPFVIRAQKSKASRSIWEDVDEDKNVGFKLGTSMERHRKPYVETTVNRVVAAPISDDDDHIAFITNRAVTQESAEHLVEEYRDRWGIETSYRVAGEFRPKTTSKEYTVRLFFYMFALLLYNVYILTNAIVRRVLDMDDDESPPVTAKTVIRKLRKFYKPPP